MKTKLPSQQLWKMMQVAAIAIIAGSASMSVVFADDAGADSIAIKFNNGGTAFTGGASDVGPDPSENWNVDNTLSGTPPGSLIEDTDSGVPGISLIATVTASGTFSNGFDGNTDGFAGNPFGSGDAAVNDVGFQPGAGATITIAGLGSEFSSGFDLYVLSAPANTGWGTTFTLNGTTVLTADGSTGTTGGVYSSYVAGGNYVEFTGLTGTGFTLGAVASPSFLNGDISGIEIVALPVAAPEPSTNALLLVGALTLGFMVRRRHVSI